MAGTDARVRRALIVDDEDAARSRLKRLLGRYRDVVEVVGEARHAAEALEQVGRLQPDVLFLDVRMPGLNGIDLAKQLESGLDIVIVTAYASYAVEAFEQNAVDYLVKPVEEERLAATISRLLQPASRPKNRETPLALFGVVAA